MKLRFLKKAMVVGLAFAAVVLMPRQTLANQTITLEVENGTDITDSFIAAAKEAMELSGTTTIVIPAGTYTIGNGERYSQLRIWGNTVVKMDGVTIKRDPSSQYSMLRFGSKDVDWDQYNGGKGRTGYAADFSNVKFIGGTWDGGGQKNCIMQIGHAQNITFENVTFQNVMRSHHLEFAGVKNLKITGCTFKDYVGDFADAYNGEAIQLEILSGTGNHFSGYNSVTDETICQDVEISGCKFLNLKRGVGSHTAITNSYFKNIQIHDNEFTNITGYAVSMLNYADSSVYNNVITNCGAGIFCSTIEKSHRNMYASLRTSNARTAPMVLGDKIYGNKITITTGANGARYNNVNYGILICGEKLKKAKGNVPAGDWRISGVTVEKNTIKITCTGYPIWLDGAVKTTVSKNKITCDIAEKGKGGVGDGIRLQGSTDNVIKSNTITNLRKKGAAAQMCGIKLIEKSDSNKIQKNTITKVSKDGIHLEDSKKITITGNTIQKPGRDGIYAYKKQLKKEADNKVKGAKRYKKNIIVVKK